MNEVQLTDLVREALGKGVHPREIRSWLKKAGVHWRYGWNAHPGGKREQARRLKQMPIEDRATSKCDCGNLLPREPGTGEFVGVMCSECLSAKWSPE